MKNIFRILTYMFLVSFFIVVMNNAFIISKSMMLFLYIFGEPTDILEVILLYVIEYFPVVIINIFVIWGLNRLLEVPKPFLSFLFYLILFTIVDRAFLYIINYSSFEGKTFSEHLVILTINSASIIGILLPKKQEEEEISEKKSDI